jgi:hypothetical protein
MKKYLFIGGIFHGCYGRCHFLLGNGLLTVKSGDGRQSVYVLQRWRDGDTITKFFADQSLSRKQIDTLIREAGI